MCMDDVASAAQLAQGACAATAHYTAQSSTAQDLDASTCIRRTANQSARLEPWPELSVVLHTHQLAQLTDVDILLSLLLLGAGACAHTSCNWLLTHPHTHIRFKLWCSCCCLQNYPGSCGRGVRGLGAAAIAPAVAARLACQDSGSSRGWWCWGWLTGILVVGVPQAAVLQVRLCGAELESTR